MRKFISFISLVTIMCPLMTGRADVAHAGWDQRALESQTQSAVYLRARIEKLEQENESLRNSYNKLRLEKQQSSSGMDYAYDVRIQALIEENKRLSNMLARGGNARNGAENLYEGQVQELNKQNDQLKNEIARLASQQKYQGQANNQQRVLAQEVDRLKLELSRYENQNRDVLGYQKTIESLRLENADLLRQQKTIASAYKGDDRELSDLTDKNQKLEVSLEELRLENRNLGQALAEMSSKALGYQDRTVEVVQSEADNVREIAKLNARVKAESAKSKALEARIITLQAGIKNDSSARELEAMIKQNQSLRDTIKAQNEILVSSDNAGQAAERYISENQALRRKLEEAQKSSDFNATSAQDVMARMQQLEGQLAQKDQNLEGLKNTVKQLSDERDRKENIQRGSHVDLDFVAALKDKNKALEVALKKERDTVILFKNKVREYQDELDMLKTQKQSALGVSTSIIKKNNDDIKNVKYIETNYPPVEQVLPVLDQDGGHISYESSEIKPEDLLSKELKPLKNIE